MKVQVQMIAAFDQLITRFSRAPAAVRSAAELIMQDVGQYLWARVRQNLSGDILQLRTGRLRDSIQWEVISNDAGITARVFSDGSVPYSKIQERGGTTPPHMIVVKNAQALRYEMSGGFRFSLHVHHPGSKIPESMYIRRVLIQERTNVTRMIRQGMRGVA